MTIERLEELTNQYLQQMQLRVTMQVSDKMAEDLQREYEQIVQEFINLHPGVLEKYREEFEYNPMREEVDASSENIVNKIYERIVTVRRKIEQDEDIKKVEENSKQQEKEANFGRQAAIKDKLQEAFQKVEIEMKKREFNINWDSLKGYCNRIISNHIETIEQNVFKKNENDIIMEEVERYIEEIKQEMSQEKSEDMKLEFKDGPVCPVVTDTNKFSEINRQIADDVQEKKETSQNEKAKENDTLVLPGDVIE
ncbi:MAG: hypothetical protein J6A04_00535 [Clostridia bacterium]|nr:hypothetical protein [Clostridia bacterium]